MDPDDLGQAATWWKPQSQVTSNQQPAHLKNLEPTLNPDLFVIWTTWWVQSGRAHVFLSCYFWTAWGLC